MSTNIIINKYPIILVTLKDAYEILGSQGEEVGHQFDEDLLRVAQDDKEKMAATEYVAGAITYKVRYWNLFFNNCKFCDFSLIFCAEK